MADVINNRHSHHFSHLNNMFSFFSRGPVAPAVEVPQLVKDMGAKMNPVSEDRIEVVVGSNGKTRTWKLHKDLVSQFSTYFSEEAGTGKFYLPNQDPAVFALFVQWLYSEVSKNPTTVGAPDCELSSSDPWVLYAHKAWDLGQLLHSSTFCRYALVKYMQGIRFVDSAVVMDIFHDEARVGTPIQRFTKAWLWYLRHTHALLWNVQSWWISDGDLADPVSGPVVKRMLREAEFSGECGLLDRAVDPHWLRLDHWYHDCSSNARFHNCSHVPYPCNMNMWGTRMY